MSRETEPEDRLLVFFSGHGQDHSDARGERRELVVHGNEVHPLVRTLSRIAWLIWVLLGGLVVLVGLFLTRKLARARRLFVGYWVSWPAYALLLILVLQTI